MSAEQTTADRRITPSKCAACNRPLETPVFCAGCHTLYPADDLDFFGLLGLERRYDLDAELLRQRYLERARTVHPDRFPGGGAEVMQLCLRISARINRAFEVLADPVLRAEYLLEMAGGKSAARDKTVPQEVLMQTLELREQIEEAKGANDREALARYGERIAGLRAAMLEQIAALACQLPGSEQTRDDLRVKLNTVKYHQKMLEQL